MELDDATLKAVVEEGNKKLLDSMEARIGGLLNTQVQTHLLQSESTWEKRMKEQEHRWDLRAAVQEKRLEEFCNQNARAQKAIQEQVIGFNQRVDALEAKSAEPFNDAGSTSSRASDVVMVRGGYCVVALFNAHSLAPLCSAHSLRVHLIGVGVRKIPIALA